MYKKSGVENLSITLRYRKVLCTKPMERLCGEGKTLFILVQTIDQSPDKPSFAEICVNLILGCCV